MLKTFQQNYSNFDMDSHDSVMDFETEEHIGYTPPVSNNAGLLPQKCKNRSEAWNHFTPMLPNTEMSKSAKCKHCGSLIKYSGVTSTMLAHLRRCSDNPDNAVNVTMHEPSSSSMENREAIVNSFPSVPKFDQEVSRMDLTKMFVAMELPFQKDVEKAKMKTILSQNCRRVCITTDTWTSTQDSNYTCLTGHYIDNNWKLQKNILNFTQVIDYTGEIMAKTIKRCLNGWELNRVLSVTVDNASSNDVGIQHLKRWLHSQNDIVLNGEYLYTRCSAHILNLIVKDGMKEVDDSVVRIRAAVRYVRRTPSRFQRFKKCIDHETIGYKGYVGRDCETRWNSTYLMLKGALKYNKTFTELEFRDRKYFNEMSKDKGVPRPEDWEHVELILPFLLIFHEARKRILGSSYVTSNMYMLEVLVLEEAF
ncbi:hypothetical protein KIW84_021515 [Lathyrus oleraceus]|uniref:BED-type domain-containing protein n=1 Tax=Pisum sativum TaxID=3888 RepID=A0A9D5B9G2_PEA|nr:hypothetical protein KIW84_021515 [Pisum sativum]